MTFQIDLSVPDTLVGGQRCSEIEVRLDGLSAHDEWVHVLGAQCRVLAGHSGVAFHVAGFGQERWPVDVETDLAVALEQLPEFLSRLHKRADPLQLNFYEQGLERYVRCVHERDTLRLECVSMSAWQPSPAVEVLGVTEAKRIFRTLHETYTSTVAAVCPWLSELPAYVRWKTAVARSESLATSPRARGLA
jgi:hypothetical protein